MIAPPRAYVTLLEAIDYDHVFVMVADIPITGRSELRALPVTTMIVDGWTQDWYFPQLPWTTAKGPGFSNIPNPRQLYVRAQIEKHDFMRYGGADGMVSDAGRGVSSRASEQTAARTRAGRGNVAWQLHRFRPDDAVHPAVVALALGMPSAARAADDPLLAEAADLPGFVMFHDSGAPGMVLVVVRGDATLMRFYGETEKGNHHLPDGTSLLRLNSVTKVFTTEAVAALAAEGRLALTDPLQSISLAM